MPKKPKPRKVRIDGWPDEDIAKALRANRGIQSYAADALGISMPTMTGRIQKSPYLQQVREECVERRLDRAENALSNLVEDEHFGALCFLLKTKGKSRGYQETANIIVTPELLETSSRLMQQIEAAQEARKIADKTNNSEQ